MFRQSNPPENIATSQSNPAAEAQFTVLAPHYDELMQVVPYNSWVEYILLLLDLAEAKPRSFLDCACGTGNVSFELARRGYEVTGIDLSSGMIASARQKADKERLSKPLRFFEGDLSTFDLDEYFDAATCLYDSLNYILEPAQLERAFARIAQHISSGGIFIFDVNTPWAFKADLFSQRNSDPRRQLHYDWRAAFDSQTRLCEVTMVFERKNADGITETFSEVHRERAYSHAEISTMLHTTGWRLLKTYDAYTTNPPHAKSERWYFVAQRT